MLLRELLVANEISHTSVLFHAIDVQSILHEINIQYIQPPRKYCTNTW